MSVMRDTFGGLLWMVRREPWRAGLTLFGVALGAASIVFLVSLLAGADVALRRLEHHASGDDLNRVTRDEPEVLPGTTVLPLDAADARALVAASGPGQAEVVYKYRERLVPATRGGEQMTVALEGGGSEFARVVGLELLHGRWLHPEEDGERRAMVGFEVWQNLFASQWPVADPRLVLDSGVSVVVVGVFAHRASMGAGEGPQTWRLDRKVWVSNRTFRVGFANRTSLDELVLRHEPVADEVPDVLALARRLDRLLENRQLGVRNFEFAALSKEEEQGLGPVIALAIGRVLTLAAVFSLLVGGINVMNAELMKLAERTREYGVRRALGATGKRLALELVLETLVFCAVGGAAGVALGVGGAWALSAALTALLTPWPFVVAPWSVLTVLGASLLVGALAGAWPARRARRLLIVECLRDAG